jgi:hypothetical protein
MVTLMILYCRYCARHPAYIFCDVCYQKLYCSEECENAATSSHEDLCSNFEYIVHKSILFVTLDED